MTSKKNWFVECKSENGDSVYMENNQECEIVGVGLVLLKLSNNKEVLLKGVRHVPKLKRNIISLGMLDDIGYSIHAEKGCLEIVKQDRVILTRRKKEGLYIARKVNRSKYALVSKSEKDNELEL
ncbi:uncharacterized protein LOC120084070 [Benincasa hispida]|uniref:uncharacterized protein LOC120084070 n=1 Tax=Benincasa hispida TaxID=102211 RepID=UPI001901207A|nr:uncharacterized protein LOC120084070 [Benincasa hispida]